MNRHTVLDAVQRAAEAFSRRAAGDEVPGITHVPEAEAAEVARALREGRDWVLQHEDEEDETGETVAGVGDGEYASHNPVIALAQSALETALPQPAGAVPELPLRAIRENLRFQLSGEVDRFIEHKKLTDFVYPLADQSTVVLVGDWGTGKDRARRVADRIREIDPDHIIHLGDIYPSGTPEMAQEHFIDIWEDHGPDRAKYWAMNGNHEMNAQGVGYFGLVLTYCQDQESSYFSLENEHWKLIALDSAYRDFDLDKRQIPWLEARLDGGNARNILLTHHQMFSAVDPRPAKDSSHLKDTMKPFVDAGKIFGWFWGHEHWMLSYAREAAFGNYFARALGHGGKRVMDVSGQHNGNAPAVKHYWNRPHPTVPGRCLNGFAVLRFDGPTLTISYPDETSTLDLFPEVWPGAPH